MNSFSQLVHIYQASSIELYEGKNRLEYCKGTAGALHEQLRALGVSQIISQLSPKQRCVLIGENERYVLHHLETHFRLTGFQNNEEVLHVDIPLPVAEEIPLPDKEETEESFKVLFGFSLFSFYRQGRALPRCSRRSAQLLAT